MGLFNNKKKEEKDEFIFHCISTLKAIERELENIIPAIEMRLNINEKNNKEILIFINEINEKNLKKLKENLITLERIGEILIKTKYQKKSNEINKNFTTKIKENLGNFYFLNTKNINLVLKNLKNLKENLSQIEKYLESL